jgi:hypothetical protein
MCGYLVGNQREERPVLGSIHKITLVENCLMLQIYEVGIRMAVGAQPSVFVFTECYPEGILTAIPSRVPAAPCQH